MTQEDIKYKVVSILTFTILISSALFGTLLLNIKIPTVEAGSTWTQTSDKHFNNGTFTNTTMVGSGEDTDLIITPNLHSWIKKIHTYGPKLRSNSPLATIYGTDKVMLFGGYGNYWDPPGPPTPVRIRNDTWVYDLSNDSWTEKFPVNFPLPRVWHGLASIYDDDKVLLFGGQNDETSKYFNDTWVYDLSDNNWTKKMPKNNPGYDSRPIISSIYGTDKILLFGGGYGNKGTWIYDLNQDNWTLMYPNTEPSNRIMHALAPIHGTDKVVLFGGYSYYDETWVYDLSENNWTQKTPTTNPGGRYLHAMASIHSTDKIVLFGGSWSNNDMWVYDLSQNEWTTIILNNQSYKPGATWSPLMATIFGTNKVVLYGGGSGNSNTWIYTHNLSLNNGTYISEPFDTGANSSFYKINWNASTPVNTNIRLQLRSGAAKSDLAAAPFVGPDGAASTYYTTSPMDVWSGHFGDRWVQYKIFFNHNLNTDSPALHDVKITYNCLPTTIVISPNNGSWLTNNKPTFKWSFNDYDSPYQQAFQVLIDRNINFTNVAFDSGEQYSSEPQWEFPQGTNYDLLPEGKWYWKVRTCDEDGAWTKYTQPRVLIIDTQNPTSSTTMPMNNGFYNCMDTISGIAVDRNNGSGVVKVEIAIKRVSDNSYWDGFKWAQFLVWLPVIGTHEWTYDSSTVPWSSGMKYLIQTRATDKISNIEQPDSGNIFTLDLDSPVSKIETPSVNVWLNNLNTITGNALDISGSGIDKVEISIKCIKNGIPGESGNKVNNYWEGKEWSSKEHWLPVSGLNQWSFDSSLVPWYTGDHYLIRCRASDKAGNIEIPSEGNTFMYDSTLPEAISIYINNGEVYTNSNNVILSLEVEDIGSGISQMAFSKDKNDWSAFEPFNTTKDFDLSFGDGEKTIYFRVKDNAGNIAESIFDTIILDTEPPEELIIAINDDAEFTNSNTVLLNLRADDTLSGLNLMSFSYDGLTWTTLEKFRSEKTLSLQAGDGKKRIYFRVSDKAGNIAFPVSDSIILDTTPPKLLSATINGGASETRSTKVFLEFNAEDSLSGVDKISFSLDNTTWSAWEEFSRIKYYTIPPGAGMKTIYIRVKDCAGNVAKPVTETIYLNTTLIEDISSEKTSPSIEEVYFLFILIIIIILIVMAGLWFVISMKRMKRLERELLLPGTVTIKPIALPETAGISDQIPAAPQQAILPETTIGTITQQSIISTPPAPVLAKTTQVGIPKATVAATITPQLPQLPPAQTDNTVSEVKENDAAPSTIITPTLATSPTVQTLPEQTPDITQPPQPVPEKEDNKCEEDSSN